MNEKNKKNLYFFVTPNFLISLFHTIINVYLFPIDILPNW